MSRTLNRILQLAGLALLMSIAATALAGLINQSGTRHFVSGGGGGGSGNRLVGDEWFASDMDSSGDGPNYGFTSFTADARNVVTYNASGGPANRPNIRQVVSNNTGSDGFGAGWFVDPVWTNAQCSYSDLCYVRFSWRAVSTTSHEQKLIIIAQNATSEGRVILTNEDWNPPDPGYAWRLQKDGGDDFIQHPFPGNGLGNFGSWQDIQIEIHFSSAQGVADGGYKLWYNNDTYASPTTQTSGIVVNPSQDSDDMFMGWSGFMQQTDSPITYEWADVRTGPTFNSSWHSSGS